MVYYLHNDHLGSTSLATDVSGAGVSGSRALYYPYGGVRWPTGGSTLPTDYTFTGQRNEAGIGLMDYNARFYDAAIGRFISADTIVPNAANPQDLNRYAYARGNPLKYSDPTGYYSEDEIMQAFDASTWDHVLEYFRKGGTLEGRWGWLEILRRAEDGYMVTGDDLVPTDSSLDEFEFGAWSGGFFGRNGKGEILIGGESNIDFALQHEEYTLQRPSRSGGLSPYPKFQVRAGQIHLHPHLRFGPDWTAASQDLTGVVIDFIGEAMIATLTPPGVAGGGVVLGFGLAIDLGSGIEGFSRIVGYKGLGTFTSRDVLDVAGVVPAFGMIPDAGNFLSHFTGLYVEVTP
ncbi:MAG: RHS repeat-associated core domain-containing protein [Chloroflexota bacterium]|nr:RHS repeat-associated core domain-containing protein [Chloroflexota bacterium]